MAELSALLGVCSAVLHMIQVALQQLMPLFGKDWQQELLRTLLAEMER